ncbi:hypothetical protein PG994_014610 [Apiospora phragmitis]|uniref:NadR/Ttd14 AAA domain-containing protein n=1 Tax=Apiospora phragmitis TaxID=2905665 RepID=A0ABR1T4T6_9PEZI
MATPPQNIYIIGAQSTGKTTLVIALEAHFRQDTSSSLPVPSVIREVARSVLRDHDYTAQDIRDSPARALELQRLILAAQAKAERETEEKAASASTTPCWLLSDRSAIDPVVYAWLYVGQESARSLMESAEWRGMRDRMAQSLVVVCEAGVKWLTDDGVRLMPTGSDEWTKTHEVFCQVLEEARLRYILLPCTLGRTEERLAFVLREVNAPGRASEKTPSYIPGLTPFPALVSHTEPRIRDE